MLPRALAAVGRTALSCYLATSLICAFVFDGWGLGRFGEMRHSEVLPLVFGIWLALLVGARLWLLKFRFGPAEWLWRAATFAKLP